MKPRFITSEEAIKALPDREIIHCFAGNTGADWDKKGVIEELERAEKIAWTENIFGHELAIEPSKETSWNCVLRFDVKCPT